MGFLPRPTRFGLAHTERRTPTRSRHPRLSNRGAGLLPKDLSAEVPAATELTDEDTGNSSDEETVIGRLTIAIKGTTHPKNPHLHNPSS